MQVSRSHHYLSLREASPEAALPLAPQRDADTFRRDPFLNEVDRAAFLADDDRQASVAQLEDLAARASPAQRAYVDNALVLTLWMLAGHGEADEAQLRKQADMARALDLKHLEFDALANLFAFRLTKRPFRTYWSWMQIARLFRPYDKEALHAAIRLIPDVLPGSSAVVCDRAVVLLAHPIGRKLRRFAHEVIAPAAQRCLEDPHERGGFCYSARALRRLIRACR